MGKRILLGLFVILFGITSSVYAEEMLVQGAVKGSPDSEFHATDFSVWWPRNWSYEGDDFNYKGSPRLQANGGRGFYFLGMSRESLAALGDVSYRRSVYQWVGLGTGTYKVSNLGRVEATRNTTNYPDDIEQFYIVITDKGGNEVFRGHITNPIYPDEMTEDILYEFDEFEVENGMYKFSIEAIIDNNSGYYGAYFKVLSLQLIDGDPYEPEDDDTSGVNSLMGDTQISILDGAINVSANENMNSLAVYNINGSLVYQQSNINKTSHVVNLSNSKGVYFITVNTATGKSVTKVIL